MRALSSLAVFQFTPPRRGRQRTVLITDGTNLFQFTPPRRGRHAVSGRSGKSNNFNSRPREGGDQRPQTPRRKRWDFNSRPREGGDEILGFVPLMSMQFQFTPPRRGRHMCPAEPCRSLTAFQFTPPRRGRLPTCSSPGGQHLISIHAPAKGATSRLSHSNWRPAISIHAPAKGATYGGTLDVTSGLLFQFTPPRRGRR